MFISGSLLEYLLSLTLLNTCLYHSLLTLNYLLPVLYNQRLYPPNKFSTLPIHSPLYSLSLNLISQTLHSFPHFLTQDYNKRLSGKETHNSQSSTLLQSHSKRLQRRLNTRRCRHFSAVSVPPGIYRGWHQTAGRLKPSVASRHTPRAAGG